MPDKLRPADSDKPAESRTKLITKIKNFLNQANTSAAHRCEDEALGTHRGIDHARLAMRAQILYDTGAQDPENSRSWLSEIQMIKAMAEAASPYK